MEEKSLFVTDNAEKRLRRGTWPWFILNVILFPAPAHITLLRVKEQSFGRNIQHLGVTLLLFLILFTAALLQILYPGIGRLWMVTPILSGGVVLYGHRFIKDEFKPFDIAPMFQTQWVFLTGCILFFTMINLIPYLNLIELNQKPVELYQGWIVEPSLGQNLVIIVASLFLLFAGYIVNSSTGVSINRAFILYACFVIFSFQIGLLLLLASNWLKIRGGFWTCLIATLLGAVLALDYWDAKKIGQYIRRYFFLTCTKGFTFLFLCLCFLGLPQKCASVFSEFYYEKVKPAPVQLSPHYLVLNQQDHFNSAHDAAQQIRVLSTKAFMADAAAASLDLLAPLFNKNKTPLFPLDADVCQLTQFVSDKKLGSTGMDFEKVPLFRPMEAGWDVMFTALLAQGSIFEKDMDKYIAGFKKILPKASRGNLPGIDTPYATRHVALATGMSVDFIVPEYQHIESLVANGFSPVLSLRLAGKDRWATLLHVDKDTGLVWVRMETGLKMEKSIQLLFDSNDHHAYKDEIVSRSMVALPLEYFRKTLALNGTPIVVFSKNGLAEEMSHWVSRENLVATRGAVAASSRKQMGKTETPRFSPAGDDPFLYYANYLSTMTWVKSILQTKDYRHNLFVEPESLSGTISGIDLFTKIESLLREFSPLYEHDRLEIAYLLVKNNHVKAAQQLFIKLATPKPSLSDLIDCREAFMIGRQLHLLGYGKEALSYLEIAFQRHPFFAEYELWYHIAKAKLKMPLAPFLSNINQEPSLTLYHKTIVDLENGRNENALKRLEKVLAKDSHDSLVNHLLNKYFNRPLNERHFFSTPEGL